MSKAEHHNPHPPLTEPWVQPKEYEFLFDIRMFIVNWSREYGPIASWPHTLELLYDKSVEIGGEEEWREDLNDKVRQGLTALCNLKALFLELPTHSKWMVRDIWCQAFELAAELQRGIACIQTHLAMYGN
jgi:hypothetical protein